MMILLVDSGASENVLKIAALNKKSATYDSLFQVTSEKKNDRLFRERHTCKIRESSS